MAHTVGFSNSRISKLSVLKDLLFFNERSLWSPRTANAVSCNSLHWEQVGLSNIPQRKKMEQTSNNQYLKERVSLLLQPTCKKFHVTRSEIHSTKFGQAGLCEETRTDFQGFVDVANNDLADLSFYIYWLFQTARALCSTLSSGEVRM